MGILQERLAKYTLPQQYQAKGVYPYFRAIEGKQGTEVEMGGHHVLMFGSNAYTGLTGDERIIQAGIKAMEKYGSGCAGSRFLNGTLDLHVKLEKELAEFIGMEDSLSYYTVWPSSRSSCCSSSISPVPSWWSKGMVSVCSEDWVAAFAITSA